MSSEVIWQIAEIWKPLPFTELYLVEHRADVEDAEDTEYAEDTEDTEYLGDVKDVDTESTEDVEDIGDTEDTEDVKDVRMNKIPTIHPGYRHLVGVLLFC